MKALVLGVLLLLLAGNALGIEITIQVFNQDGQELEGVDWRVEESANGFFNIYLPDISESRDGKHLTVSLTSTKYEQVNWILNAQAAENLNCRNLTVRLRPNQKETRTPDRNDSDTLDNYYNSEGRSLYLLLSSELSTLPGIDASAMLESFRKNIIDHLQTLPVIPPPQDITVPENVSLEKISGLQVRPEDMAEVWLFGDYLEALAMIYGRIVPKEDFNSAGCIRFDYQMIPFLKDKDKDKDFAPVREVMFYPLTESGLLSDDDYDDDYEEISKHWGFYTVLALCVREVLEYISESKVDRSGLEHARAYLVAERSRLGPDEPLKKDRIQALLQIVDGILGKGKALSILKRQLQR